MLLWLEKLLREEQAYVGSLYTESTEF